jgi:hypothetical protein
MGSTRDRPEACEVPRIAFHASNYAGPELAGPLLLTPGKVRTATNTFRESWAGSIFGLDGHQGVT